MNKIAIVTGGAGFIGSHMVDFLLKKNFKVRVIDNFSGGHKKNLAQHKNNPLLQIHKLNILDLKDEKIFKHVDYVFHFAGIGDIVPSIEKPKQYMDVNVQGTINILELCRNTNLKKFVYAASSSCYGLASTPTKENHKISTLYPYALSKYFGEQSAFHWSKVYDIPINSIRIFNAYGTRVRTTGAYGAVFGVFFKQKLENHPFTIVGDGKQRRDFIYVTDLVRAFYLAAKTSHNQQIYNVGAGQPQSINKLAKLIGQNKIIYLPKRPGEPECTWANISKITKELKWKPKISFEEGVGLMMKEIDNWKNAPLWNKKNISEATKIWFKYMNKKS